MTARVSESPTPGFEPPPPAPNDGGEPARLIDKDVLEQRDADQKAQRQKLERLRYSIAALLVADAIVGAWIYLHAPGALASFSLANFAVFGVSGVLKLLPPEEREALKKSTISFARKGLSTAKAPRWLAVLVAALLLIAAFSSSVGVKGSAGATAELRVVVGSESDASERAMRTANTMRLAEAGGEVVDRRLITPFGRSLWAYTSTHVSRGSRKALPWRPVRWTYPTDFDEQVTLFVLPMTSAVGPLTVDKPALVLRDLARRELLRSPLTGHGARVQFSDRAVDVNALAVAWTMDYRNRLVPADSFGLAIDSVLVIGLLAPNDTLRRIEALKRHDEVVQRLGIVPDRVNAWRSAVLVKPARPLHLGEKVVYEFDHAGTTAGPFELVLDRNPYFLLLDGAAVVKPKVQSGQ
jgi:hypothetical protein